MTLRQKQSKFAVLYAKLILKAERLGYEVTLGETHRPRSRSRKRGSLHTLKLAGDLHLFLHGRYLRDSSAHYSLGKWWERQSTPGVQCCWGGRFKRPDGNHYSVAHGGLK